MMDTTPPTIITPDDPEGPKIRLTKRQATGDSIVPDSGTGSIVIDIENETDEPSHSASASLLLGTATNEEPADSPAGNLSVLETVGGPSEGMFSTRGNASTSASQSSALRDSRFTTSSPRPSPVFNPDLESVVNADITGDADVWKKYIENAIASDERVIENWNSNMDVILIFAGLFSAILTAFIIEFYRLLKPEQDDITSKLLVDISSVLRANAQNQPIPPPIEDFTTDEYDFVASNSIVWVNSLWFSSLILSLSAAVAAMVVKQWFQFYVSNLNSGNAHTDALHRQYRYNALRSWKVPEIVSALPLLMHLSVALFFLGLVILLLSINASVGKVVLVWVIVFAVIYITSTLFPLIAASCPYKSSALVLLQDAFEWSILFFWTALYWMCHAFELSPKELASVKERLKLGGEFAGLDFVGRVRMWLRSFSKGTAGFFRSPPAYAKRHRDQARKVKDEDWEEVRIEKTQSDLDVDSIIWLIKASGKQNLVDLGLACISQLNPEPHLIDLCLRHNIQSLLIANAYLALPNPDHDFWKKLKLATPSTCLSRKDEMRIPAIQTYMQSLMFLWHHPVYFSNDPPPAISYSLVWDKPTYFADSQWRLRLADAAVEPSLQPPPRIFGDWLILWRAMKEQSDDFHTIAYRGWNLNFFAEVVCTETHFYHLTRGSSYVEGSLRRDSINPPVEDDAPWSDLYDLLNDYGKGALQLNDKTVENVLDTFIYVVSSTRKPETHILLRTDLLVVLLQLLKLRLTVYDAILEKLILGLQMFTVDGWKRKQRGETYFKNGGMGKFNRNKAYQRLATVLYTLITSYSSMVGSQSPQIVDLAAVLLYRTQLELDQPEVTYDETFITLPPDHAHVVIDHISKSTLHEWRTTHTLLWMVGLLSKWCTSPDAKFDVEDRKIVIQTLGDILCYSWSESVLALICAVVLPVFKELLESANEDIAGKVSDDSCHSLQSMFHRDEEHKSVALLMQYIEHRVFTAVAGYLQSDRSTPKARSDWQSLRKRWRNERPRNDPDERNEYEALRSQTHSDTPDVTPLLVAGDLGRAPTPSKRTIIWKSTVQTPDDASISRYSPSASPRNSYFSGTYP